MIPYTLERKKVRNLNLRVRRDGSVWVSAPRRMPLSEIEAFLLQKQEWIAAAQARRKAEADRPRGVHTAEECLAVFEPISARCYPLFADLLPQPPQLRVREMKSRWGVCYPQRGCITLNARLLDYPTEAIEYVILHEYVHFRHPDHQAGFHAELARLMPDYKARRALLRQPAQP